jgi:hypothetical protein
MNTKNKMIILSLFSNKWNSNTTGVLFSGILSACSMQMIPVFLAFFRICQWADEKQNLPEMKKL